MFRAFSLYRLLGLSLLFSSCQTDYENLPTYDDRKQLQAVVEIPAGTNQPITYDAKTREFNSLAGRLVRFLPYPGNFGFIPSTSITAAQGGDDRPVDILVLAESQPSGTVLAVMPLGLLLLERDGLLDPKVIATPAKPSQQLLAATDFATFNQEYPVVKNILTQWFQHANPGQKVRIIGWKNEQYAEEYIRKRMK